MEPHAAVRMRSRSEDNIAHHTSKLLPTLQQSEIAMGKQQCFFPTKSTKSIHETVMENKLDIQHKGFGTHHAPTWTHWKKMIIFIYLIFSI